MDVPCVTMFWDQVYLIPLGGGAPLKMISFEVFRLPWGFDLGGPWPRFCNVLDVGGLTWAQATSSSSDLYVQISPSHPSLESGSAEFPCVDLQFFPVVDMQSFPEWICNRSVVYMLSRYPSDRSVVYMLSRYPSDRTLSACTRLSAVVSNVCALSSTLNIIFWLVRRWLPLWKRPFRSVVYMLSRYPSDRSVVYMLCAILQIICSRRVVATHWSCPIRLNLYILITRFSRKRAGEANCRCSLSRSALLNPL